LPAQIQSEIRDKKFSTVNIPLDNKNIRAVFYKKQDYEAFAIPLGFPVLEDINFKKELRLMDQAIARTAQQAILLITMGAEPDKGGINPKALEKIQKMFENESVARVVIADYTTKASFVIPQIADILDPKKYEIVDRDIAIGLNNVLLGQGEKFANQHAKIEIFVERLKHARQAFLNEFLIPEIKRISEILGFKSYPTPYYEEIDLKNDIEYSKIYTRLAELGILTADETIKAIETGTLPTPESNEESHTKFKKLKDKGLYEPLLSKKTEEAGRPDGTKQKKSKVTVGPLKGELIGYSLTKIKDNFIAAERLDHEVMEKLKQKLNLTDIQKQHQEFAHELTTTIMINEDKSKWFDSISQYLQDLNQLTKQDQENFSQVNEIAAEHGINFFEAAVLFHSRVEH